MRPIPALLRVPRSRWIATATAALAAGGVDSVRVDALATELGVTKGSFYGHFANRAELLTAILDEWERASTEDVRQLIDAADGDPVSRISDAGALTFSKEILPVDLAGPSLGARGTSGPGAAAARR